MVCALVALLACNLPPSTGRVGSTQDPLSDPPSAAPSASAPPTPTASAAPLPTQSAPSGPDAELSRFGVTVMTHFSNDSQRGIVLSAVRALAARLASLAPPGADSDPDGVHVFGRIFGPTVLRIYPNQNTVDGVHAALNCGWEGRFAAGCKQPDIFPEQDFPPRAWLILVSGGFMAVSPDGGVGLIAHEMSHNLTWGSGNLESNVEGWNFATYVGDYFVIEYMDYLSVQAGRDTYVDEAARAANPTWRAEITADFIASWALDGIQGPDVKVVNKYLDAFMTCKVYGVGRC